MDRVKITKKNDRFQPTVGMGKLLFFDYNKKKFGFISVTKCDNCATDEKVYLSENGLSTKRRLWEGESVTFLLNKGQRGYYATNVMSLTDMDIKSISTFQDIIGLGELAKALYNSVEIQKLTLDSEDQSLIIRVIQRENSIDAWKLLIRYSNDESFIDNYVSTFITPLKDSPKIEFLIKGFRNSLLDNIILNWESNEKALILKLIDFVKRRNIIYEEVPGKLLNVIQNIEWSYEETIAISAVLKCKEIQDLILKYFSFRIFNCTNKLKSLIPINIIDNTSLNILRENLISDKDNISLDNLFDVFEELKDYAIIKDENHLLEILSTRNFDDSSIFRLVSQLSDECNVDLFRLIISNNIDSISSYRLIQLLGSCKHNNRLAINLIELYYSNGDKKIKPDFQGLIDYLIDENNLVLISFFLDKFHKSLAQRYPLEILELAILSGDIEIQKIAYQNLIFNTEKDILAFIEKFHTLNLKVEVKSANKPLTAFISLLKSESNFNFTEESNQFLQNNKGIVQCLIVKFLVYQFYKKRIDRTKLVEILNSFQWTEISALLIKAFIQESNYSGKVLLDKLSAVFKTHFEILSTHKFEPKSFRDNFTIRNILNYCNGRKYYNAELWQGKRWYVKANVSVYTKERLNCYCEGRPWKKEHFWLSATNQPTTEQYEFYWCKRSYCAARNDNVNLDRPFNDWTLAEIAIVLNIEIEKIALATLAGWVNRMNQIVEHLYCRDCKEVLRPLPFRPTTLGYYAVPLFQCINDQCSNKEIIRFTHCLNGKCDSHLTSEPLDSRDCDSCRPNDENHTGLRCKYCGTGCPACSGQHNRIIAEESW